MPPEKVGFPPFELATALMVKVKIQQSTILATPMVGGPARHLE